MKKTIIILGVIIVMIAALIYIDEARLEREKQYVLKHILSGTNQNIQEIELDEIILIPTEVVISDQNDSTVPESPVTQPDIGNM